MRRLATASLIGAMLLASFAGSAAAKGNAMAALDAPIPPDADPGSELEVGWRAWTPDGGAEWPFAGSPVFIRLVSTDGTSTTEVLGRENPRGSGHYLATISVPPGGVGRVEIGLLGESCVDGSCTRGGRGAVDPARTRGAGPGVFRTGGGRGPGPRRSPARLAGRLDGRRLGHLEHPVDLEVLPHEVLDLADLAVVRRVGLHQEIVDV
jgi:hypothetical protein